MAQNAPADPPSGGRPLAAPQSGRVLDNLWMAASSPRLTIALAVVLALTFAVAGVLPQLPAGSDPLTASRWLSSATARYGRLGARLAGSGFFDVLNGPWIIALLALSGWHLILRVAIQGRRMVAPRRSPIPVAPQGLPFELAHLPVGMDGVQLEVEALAAGGPRGSVVADPSGARPRVDVYLERRHRAAVGPLMTYLGPLLVVLGLLWNSLGGWRVTGVTLIPGRTVQPAQAGGLALSLVDAGSSDGARPGVISFARGGETRYRWLGYGRPATWGAVWVAQAGGGPALAVQASTGGKLLPVESLEAQAAPAESLHLRFGKAESEQGFALPAANLVFRVVSYENLADRGIGRPVFLIEGYQGTDPTPGLSALVEDSETIEWQGVALALQREAYVVADLAAMPGLPLLGLGALALLAGAAVTAWGGLTRTWLDVAAEGDGSVVAVRVAAPAVGQAEVARVAARISAAAIAARKDAAGEAGSKAGGEADRLPASGLGAHWRQVAGVLAGALVLVGLAALALCNAGELAPQGPPWIVILYAAFAALGLGALAPAAIQSLWFMWHSDRHSEIAGSALFEAALPGAGLPGIAQGLRGRAGDPGRAVSLAAFPLLTAALLLGSLRELFVFAAPVRPVAAQMWLWAAWLLATAYFHATSGWRPLRVPAWLAPVLIVAAFIAGIAACLTAPSLLNL